MVNIQNDDTGETGAGTIDDPIVIKMNSAGVPADSSGKGWSYSNNILTLDNYYYRITGTCACKISAPTYAHIIHGGVFSNSVSSYISSSENQVSIVATDCTINDVISSYAYVVGSETITVTFPADISSWNVTVTSSKYPYPEQKFNLTNSKADFGWFSFIPDISSHSLVIKTYSSGVKKILVEPVLADKELIIENGYPYGSNTVQKYKKWEYDPASGLTLKSGNFSFASNVVVKCPVIIESSATLDGGTYAETVTNKNASEPTHIKGGIFLKKPINAQETLQQESCVINVTLDSAEYTVNGLPLDSDSKTFYYSVSSAGDAFPVEIKYTGGKDVYRWNTKVGASEVNIAPGQSSSDLQSCIRTVSSDGKTITLTVSNSAHITGNVILKAVYLPYPTVKATLTNNKTGEIFILEPCNSSDTAPEFPYVAEGYTFSIAPSGNVDTHFADIQNNVAIQCNSYWLRVSIPESSTYREIVVDYYFNIVEPTYSVTIDGSGEAYYNHHGTDIVLGAAKVEKDTIITLKSTVAPNTEYPFDHWNFDSTEDIIFTDASGTALSADAIDLTISTVYFKMPARNVNISVITAEPVTPPTPDTPSDPVTPADPVIPPDSVTPTEDDTTATAAVVAGGIVAGGVLYLIGTQIYLETALPQDTIIPTNRQQLADLLWQKAGKPEPSGNIPFADISTETVDSQKAALWCVEQGLLKDYGKNFKPNDYIFRLQVIKAWNDLQAKLNTNHE